MEIVLTAQAEEVKKQHPLKFITKMVWVSIFMVITFDVGVNFFVKYFQVVVDYAEERCIPEHSVYLLNKNSVSDVLRGKTYTFRAKGMQPFYPDNTLITKYVVGLPNDRVVINEHGAFINGERVSNGYPAIDKLSVPEAALYKSYVLGDGEYFVSAPAQRSFDSRYWGVLKQEQIVGRAVPLW